MIRIDQGRVGRWFRRPDPVDWGCALVAVAVLTGFAALLVTGRYIADGPILLTVSAQHGLHEGDLYIGTGWVLAVLAVLLLTVRRRRG